MQNSGAVASVNGLTMMSQRVITILKTGGVIAVLDVMGAHAGLVIQFYYDGGVDGQVECHGTVTTMNVVERLGIIT